MMLFLLDLLPPPSPIFPLLQRGAFTPSMGGSSRRALPGPPIKIIILDVSPFRVGRHPHPRRRQRLGTPLSITLRLHPSPRGRHRLVSIQSITLPHHSHASPHTRRDTPVDRHPHFILPG